MSVETWPTRVQQLCVGLQPELCTAEAPGLGARLVGEPLDPLLRPLLPAMDSLEASLRAAGPEETASEAACAAAVALLGAGFGLTPSGDDFLAGLLGTLRAARFEPRALLLHLIAAVEHAAPARTTPVSAELLAGALSGEPPAVLAGFWSALFCWGGADADAGAAGLCGAVTRLRAHGTTSPWDFLCGVATAARVHQARQRP